MRISPSEVSAAQHLETTLGRHLLVAKDMSNEVLSGLESCYRIFRSKICLGNEEDNSCIQVLFTGKPPGNVSSRKLPCTLTALF